MRVGRGTEALARSRACRTAADVRLQMAATGARTLTGPAVVDDDYVPELYTDAVTAAERLAAGDDAAADAGPEREHDQIVLASPGADLPLADRSRVRVVFEPDRDAEPLVHPIAQGCILERQIHGANDEAFLLVDRRRRADTHRRDRVVDQLGHGGLQLGEYAVLRVLRGRTFVPTDDAAVAGDDPGEDLRAPEVHSDRMARLHSGYRNPPHGRLRGEAVSRLPRRPDERQGAAAAARPGGKTGRPQRRPRPGPDRRTAPTPPSSLVRLDVAPLDAGHNSRPDRSLRGLGSPGLSVGLERRERREQAPAAERKARPDAGQRPPPLEPDDDPLARQRPRHREGEHRTKRGPALRLDDAAPYRPRPPPPLLPLDPARPPDGDSRLRPAEDQRGDAVRRAAARRQGDRRAPRQVPAGQSHRDRRLQPVREAHRRGRRYHGQRPGEHPLEPVRLPVQDAAAVPPMEGLALPQRPDAPDRPRGADLLPGPREPARSVVDGLQPPAQPAARRTGDIGQALQPVAVLLAALQRQFSPEADRDGPLDVEA